MTKNKFKKIIKFKPAYDKRNPDLKKNYGLHCTDMYFVLVGEKGAISFTVYTGWYLPHIIADWKNRGISIEATGADISYHSKKPIREWQKIDAPTSKKCGWLNDAPCWSDGSSLAADELFKRFVSEGEEAIWGTLKEWYHSHFDEAREQ